MNLWWILGQFVHVHHVQKSLDLSSYMACTCTIISEIMNNSPTSYCLRMTLVWPTNHVQGSLHRFVKLYIAVRQMLSEYAPIPLQILNLRALL